MQEARARGLACQVPAQNKLWTSAALAGTLLRCPSLAVLALRRAGRLAPHPAKTASISQFILHGYLGRGENAILMHESAMALFSVLPLSAGGRGVK